MNDKFIKVSVELLDMIDTKQEYELQLTLTLIYLTRLNYECCGDSYLWTTISMLVKQFGNYTNINEKSMDRQKSNFINALLGLRDKGLIEFKTEKKKPALKDELFINVEPLLVLAGKEPFVKLHVKDFLSIMHTDTITVNNEEIKKNGVESYLFWMLFSIQGEWNVQNMKKLKEYDGEVSRYIGDKHDNELAELTFVFSCSSVDTLRKRKHEKLKLNDNWCCDDYALAYINKLIELGCIKVIKRRVKTNDGWRDMNFYYSPIFQYEDMLCMVRQWASRKRYAIKARNEHDAEEEELTEQQEEPTPTVKTGGSFVQARRERKASEAF